MYSKVSGSLVAAYAALTLLATAGVSPAVAQTHAAAATQAAVIAAPTNAAASSPSAVGVPDHTAPTHDAAARSDADATASAINAVDAAQKARYDQELARYQALADSHAADASSLLAQCAFIQHFAYADDLSWGDAAGKDLEACQAKLEQRFPNDPDAALYSLEHRYGAAAIAFGTPLLGPSKQWTPAQRARVHTALWRGYSAQKDEKHAADEAIAAAELDPQSDSLNAAIRYLGAAHRQADAIRLLHAAALPKFPFTENERIRAATDTLPDHIAAEEVERARKAGIKLDPYTVARALRHAGDNAGASQALRELKPAQFESPQNQQLRLDVAFDAHDAKAAADVLSSNYAKTNAAIPLVPAYVHLLTLDFRAASQAAFVPIWFATFACFVLLMLSPGLVIVPIHYRGLLRARRNLSSIPLFERIGLRHAWIGATLFLLALFWLAMMMGGTTRFAIGDMLSHREVVDQFIQINLWSLTARVSAVAVLAYAVFEWRDWLGREKWKLEWFGFPALFCVAYPLLLIGSYTGSLSEAQLNSPQIMLVQGAIDRGGVGLAFLILCVLAPITEEFIFRGCLLGAFSRHISFGWANFIQALLFGAIHLDRPHFRYLTILGLMTGYLTRKTRGLLAPMLLHAASNLIFLYWYVHR